MNFEVRQLSKYLVTELASVVHPAISPGRITAPISLLKDTCNPNVVRRDVDSGWIVVHHFDRLELLFSVAIGYKANQT